MIAEGDKGRGMAREFGDYIPKRAQNTPNHIPRERTGGLRIGADAGSAARKFPTIAEIIASATLSENSTAEKTQPTRPQETIPTVEVPPVVVEAKPVAPTRILEPQREISTVATNDQRETHDDEHAKTITETLRRRAVSAQTLDDPIALTFDRAHTLHMVDAALDRTPTFSENAAQIFGAVARREVEPDKVHGTIELGKKYGLTEMPAKAAFTELKNAGLAEIASANKGSSYAGVIFSGDFIPDWREASHNAQEPQDHVLGSSLKITTAEVIDTLQVQIKDLAARTSRDSVAEQCQYASALALLDAAQQNKMFEPEGSSRENSLVTGEQRVLAAIFEGFIDGSLDSEQVYTPRKLQQQLQLQDKLDVDDARLMQLIRNDIALLHIAGIAKYEPRLSGQLFNLHNITGEEPVAVMPDEQKSVAKKGESERNEFHYTNTFNPYPLERKGKEIDFVIPQITDPKEMRLAVDDAFAEGIRHPQRIAEVFHMSEDAVRAIIQEKRAKAQRREAAGEQSIVAKPTELPIYDRNDPQSA